MLWQCQQAQQIEVARSRPGRHRDCAARLASGWADQQSWHHDRLSDAKTSAHRFLCHLPRSAMCWICDAMAPTCGGACAAALEGYFQAVRRREKPFSPPPLAPFLRELADSLEKKEPSQACQERENRVRVRATRPQAAAVTGMTRPNPQICPIRLEQPHTALCISATRTRAGRRAC